MVTAGTAPNHSWRRRAMRSPVWPWVLLVATQVGAQDVKPLPLRLTVDDAVARALAANLDLAVSRRDVDIARANLQRSRALMPSNPFLSAGAQKTSQSGVGPNY